MTQADIDRYGHLISTTGLAVTVTVAIVAALYFGAIQPINSRLDRVEREYLTTHEHLEFRDRVLRDQDRQDAEIMRLRTRIHDLETKPRP